MKVVLLAGGLGTRLSEETEVRPKPMVRIGSQPILWHIMKHFARYGHAEFFVALGYKGEEIKRYFLDYRRLSGSLTVRLGTGATDVHDRAEENWTVHLIETGLDTQTGGRVRRLASHLSGAPFLLTYGDGVCDLDLDRLVAFHRAQGRLVTLTAVRPPARFGGLVFDGDRVAQFQEKPHVGEGWINGGFMVCEPGMFSYLTDDATSLEAGALEGLARDGQLAAFRHEGFWQCMDTLRDVRLLGRLWREGRAPWKVWEDGP